MDSAYLKALWDTAESDWSAAYARALGSPDPALSRRVNELRKAADDLHARYEAALAEETRQKKRLVFPGPPTPGASQVFGESAAAYYARWQAAIPRHPADSPVVRSLRMQFEAAYAREQATKKEDVGTTADRPPIAAERPPIAAEPRNTTFRQLVTVALLTAPAWATLLFLGLPKKTRRAQVD
jgi:hypothetical protein